MNSIVPEHWNGGGGWSQLKFSLGSLWEQRQIVRNVWTKSNIALPLVRYLGCSFKFYRTLDVDYIVMYNRCFPMVDTEPKHTNAQPSAMLMYKHKILVPSYKTAPHKRKPYIRKRIKPPAQLQNRWYFQKDVCDTGLVMLTTTAADFQRYFQNPKAVSNNITITCLNTTVFQSRNFQQTELGTTFWGPKQDYYLYGTLNGHEETAQLKDLVFLGQTQTYTAGEPIGMEDWNTYSQERTRTIKFGNIFDTTYLHGTKNVWVGGAQQSPDKLFASKDNNERTKLAKDKLTLMSQPILVKCRYNPNKDTGIGNEIYFLKNTRNERLWDAPTDPKLVLTGYPLWLAWWGWPDWQKKLHIMQQIDLNYIAVFKTTCIPEKLPGYVPIDYEFTEGKSPYETDIQYPLPSDSQHWYPRFKYQMRSIDDICKSGPGTIKTSTNSIEAHCSYSFYFKWGGCPKQLENIEDPCNQPKYPIPSNQLQTVEIQDPISSPTKELYQFDFRRHIITASAAERIKKELKAYNISIYRCNKVERKCTPVRNRRRRRNTDTRDGNGDPQAAPPPAAKRPATPPAKHPETNQNHTTIKIIKSKIKVSLFPEPTKNRRLTPREQQWEKEDAKIWQRPERQFLLDKPTYPFFPITPKTLQPSVCFDLGFQ